MAQEGYDELMALTDSRYRLSMIVALRAAQLKAGIPDLLEPEEGSGQRNTVTVAMKELQLGKPIRWGDELPADEAVRRLQEQTRRAEFDENREPREPREPRPTL